MAITYYFSTPHDLLNKLERDSKRLLEAVKSESTIQIADNFFNFCITGFHIKDWIKNNDNVDISNKDVETYVNNSEVLEACREICHSNKHYSLYFTPKTVESTKDTPKIADGSIIANGTYKANGNDFVKIFFKSGKSFEIMQFTNEVINEWKAFYNEKLNF